jgi:hypothetical protein
MPLDPKARARAPIAFSLLFVFTIAALVGVYFVADLGKLHDRIAARDAQAILRGITDAGQIDEVLKQHPSNKLLRMVAMATKSADETNTALEKLSGEIEPPAISKAGNLGVASRSDIEALRRDLKTAETNALTLMPRTAAILKAERDTIEKYAASIQLGKGISNRVLEEVDKRHAEIMALASRTLSARADYYRAYQNYVAVLIGEFGAYKFVDGQFIFPLQRTADRYNVAARAMTSAAKPLADLEQKRTNLLESQQARWLHFIRGE